MVATPPTQPPQAARPRPVTPRLIGKLILGFAFQRKLWTPPSIKESRLNVFWRHLGAPSWSHSEPPGALYEIAREPNGKRATAKLMWEQDAFFSAGSGGVEAGNEVLSFRDMCILCGKATREKSVPSLKTVGGLHARVVNSGRGVSSAVQPRQTRSDAIP